VGTWMVLVPDGHLYAKSVVGCDDGPARTRGLRAGALPAGLREAVYSFRESLGTRGLRVLVGEARGEVRLEADGQELPQVTCYVSTSGRARPIGALLDVPAAAPLLPAAGADAVPWRRRRLACPLGSRWQARARPGTAWTIVDEVGGGDVLLGGAVGASEALVRNGSGWTKVLALSAHARDAFRERARLNGGDRSPPGPAGSGDADARTLSVDFDAQGKRYNAWREVVAEMTRHPCADWPLDARPTAVHFCARMERTGRVPSGWLDKWSQSKNIAVGDRVHYELGTILDALEYAGSYDQLNLGTLVFAELLCLRVQPNFENAKYFSGIKSLSDAVSPDLKSFTARQAKGKTESEKQRQKVMELRGKTESGNADAAGGYK
ncbi:unnamed protein product, partial [Prorocentrum cordatum]